MHEILFVTASEYLGLVGSVLDCYGFIRVHLLWFIVVWHLSSIFTESDLCQSIFL